MGIASDQGEASAVPKLEGIEYALAAKAKSDLYLDLLAAVTSGRVELPPDPTLLRELHVLERRRGRSGRDRVDHRPGGHDDRANAVAGVVHQLGHEEPTLQVFLPTEPVRPRRRRVLVLERSQ